MLRQSLGSPQEACPDPEILAAYCDGDLDAEETIRYEQHFSQCARCREQLAALDQIASTVTHKNVPAPARNWHIFDWRWLAPAFAAILIAAIWISYRPVLHHIHKSHFTTFQSNQKSTIPKAIPSLPDQTTTDINSRTFSESDESLNLRNGKKLDATPRTDQEKAVAANRPLLATNESGATSHQEPNQDSRNDSVLGMANALPKAAPSPPPAPTANSLSQLNVENDASQKQSQVQSTNSAKVDNVPEEQRTVATQAQTQEAVQVQTEAMRLEKFGNRAIANVIASPDHKTLWRINGGVIERSTDDGASWKAQFVVSNAQFTAGSAPNTDTCWLVGRNGLIVLTTDAAKWKAIPAPALADLTAVSAQSALTVTITTADGRKFSTSDAGQHWTAGPRQP